MRSVIRDPGRTCTCVDRFRRAAPDLLGHGTSINLVLLEGLEPTTIRLEDGGPFQWDFRSMHRIERGAGVEPALPLLQSGAWPLGDPRVVQERGLEPR